MNPTRILPVLAAFAAVAAGAAPPATGGPALLTDEQIEYKLFSKTKAIARAGPRSVDMHAVTFEFNSADLTGRARDQLDALGRVLSKRAFRRSRLVVGGHTDARGGEAYNRRLSQRRAEAVVEFLVRRHGIARHRLTPVGYGETRPVSGLAPDDPDQRRAEIVNLGTGNR